MTTSTVDTATGQGARGRAGLAGAVAAEWTKLWTVRSTWAALAAAVALAALSPLIVGVGARAQHAAGEPSLIAPATEVAGNGILFMGQIALLALATLTIATEYATGTIRTTLQCVPSRQVLLLAKCLVLLPVLVLAGLLITIVNVLVAVVAAGAAGQVPATGDVVRVALGAGAYLWLVGVLVVGLGAVIRSVAGTITAALLLVLLVPMMLDQSGVEALETVAVALPGSAGRVLLSAVATEPYGAGPALVVAAAWALAAQVGAGALMRYRDG